MELVIGIDTSKASGRRSRGKRYIGVVIGEKSGVSHFSRDVSSALRSFGYSRSAVHWKELDGNSRRVLFNMFRGALPSYGLKAMIFPVLREGNKRKLYLISCPAVVGHRLAELVRKACNLVLVICDSDFDSLVPLANPRARRSTVLFLEGLVSELVSTLAGKRLKAGWKKGVVELGVDGIQVVGQVGSRLDDAVQAADFVLGLFSFGKANRLAVRNVAEEPVIRG